jgi:hypothetical protein
MQAPSRAKPGEGGAPRAKQENAQDEVANNVSSLTEQGMPQHKLRRIHVKQKMKDRIKNSCGMVGRAEVCGFDSDDRQPDCRREPYSQYSLGRGSQLVILAMRENQGIAAPAGSMSRVENRRSGCSLPVVVGMLSHGPPQSGLA